MDFRADGRPCYDSSSMDPTLRRAFNAAYGPDFYPSYMRALEARLGCEIPFRVAETPLFFPKKLREKLERSAREIVEQISAPSLIAKMKGAVPSHLDVPGMDPLPNCVQVDFAITRGPDGELEGKVVELQGFPSLYALMVIQSQVLAEAMRPMPGLDRPFTIYFGGLDEASFTRRFRRAVLGGEDPPDVILMDLAPEKQKTYPDFVATKELVGIDAVCPTELVRDGRKLLRRKEGKLREVRRIYNRIVFDELAVKKVKLPFDYTDALDVSWFSHPNWYWVWSKYTMPHVDHPAVPRARLLSEIDELPRDLERFVLKPLFSFAGAGVRVDVTEDDLAKIPEAERSGWMLQEKIDYAPALPMPDGSGVKAEVRMMFLRGPEDPKPELVLNLVRLSRGKMLGVDHNRDLIWTGGTIGMWPLD